MKIVTKNNDVTDYIESARNELVSHRKKESIKEQISEDKVEDINTPAITLKSFLHEKEQQHIRNLLKQYNGNKQKTAEKLGIELTRLEEFIENEQQ